MPPEALSPLRPEVHLGANGAQPQLELCAPGVERYVWNGRFGQVLIEVRDDAVFVNGLRVEPHSESPAR